MFPQLSSINPHWLYGVLIVSALIAIWGLFVSTTIVAQSDHSERLGSFLGMRMGHWIIIAHLLLVLIYLFKPDNLGLILVKLASVFVFGTAGFFLDRHANPLARPDNPLLSEEERIAAYKRRNQTICAAMLAGAWAA